MTTLASDEALASVTVDSPLGPIRLYATDDGALCGLFLDGQQLEPPARSLKEHRPGHDVGGVGAPVLQAAARQLEEYFAGHRQIFDLSLKLTGTPFQQSVWNALCSIPFGETRSYADIARAIGQPTATRAVGAANGRNPLSIIVPCHRVIGSDGSLTGYGGGLDFKRWLLDFESRAERGGAFHQLSLIGASQQR